MLNLSLLCLVSHTQVADKHTGCIKAFVSDLSMWPYIIWPGHCLCSIYCLLHPEPDWSKVNSHRPLWTHTYILCVANVPWLLSVTQKVITYKFFLKSPVNSINHTLFHYSFYSKPLYFYMFIFISFIYVFLIFIFSFAFSFLNHGVLPLCTKCSFN